MNGKRHPELPPKALVRGRLIVRQVQPDNGGNVFLVALFTTLADSQKDGQHWRVETDLRTLKSTLKLDQLTCSTPDMVAKEIEIAMATYNLVRALICQASEHTAAPPRGYSFSQVQRIVETFAPFLRFTGESSLALLRP